ncbi:18740_t:CDS:2, partial [Racocetra persica]
QVFTTIALLLIVSAIIIRQDKPAIIFTPTTIEIIEYPRNKNETILTQEESEAAKIHIYGILQRELSTAQNSYSSIEDRNKLRKGAKDSFDKETIENIKFVKKAKNYMNYEDEEDENDEGSKNYESKNYESEDNKSKDDEESKCYKNKNNEDEDKKNEFDELENLTSRSGLNDYNIPT